MKSRLFITLILVFGGLNLMAQSQSQCEADFARFVASPKSSVSWSVAKAIHKSIDCTGDHLCQSIRVAMNSNTTLEDCQKTANPEWCYGIKRGIYDKDCWTSAIDPWMNTDVCIGLRHVLDGGDCKNDNIVYDECNDFKTAGYTREAIQRFNKP